MSKCNGNIVVEVFDIFFFRTPLPKPKGGCVTLKTIYKIIYCFRAILMTFQLII